MSKRYPGGIIRKTPQTPSQTSAQGIWDMASVTQAVKENTWPIAGVPDPISKSLRFRGSALAELKRTPASAGNRKTWTWSGWVKRGKIPSSNGARIFTAENPPSYDPDGVIFFGGTSDTDKLNFKSWVGGINANLITTQVFRDISAWYHIIYSVDTTQSTSSNRIKLYVNGVQVTSFSTATYPNQNVDLAFNGAWSHIIGSSGYDFDGYMAEINFIDGQALTPSSFGNTNDQTGVWQPIAYTGTYGTNGFYLPFSNTTSTTTLGYDFSGNSNNWTPNNISLTSGSTYDSMVDVPTQWIPYNTAGDTGALFRGNYCVLNPLTTKIDLLGVATLSNGNLQATSGGSNAMLCIGSIFITSGKWYAECTITTSFADYVGIGSQTNANSTASGTGAYSYTSGGTKISNGSSSAYGATYTTGDVIGVAYDADAGTLTFYKNGTSQGTAYSGIDVSVPRTFASFNAGTGTYVHNWNFGQRPFSYTPPTGFKTLCTTNLSTPTIGATASTQANDYFNPVLYTGNGSTQSITGLDFQPDLVYIKSRSDVDGGRMFDVLRGVQQAIFTNSTAAETTVSTELTAFNSNGFSLGNSTAVNESGQTYVGWNWKANGSGSSNTAGSITSTVSANTTAGFSIVTYTGNGSSGATVGHGLSVTPSMVIIKSRSDNTNWQVKHSALNANQNLVLNSTAATDTAPGSGYISAISSSTLTLLNGGGGIVNVNGNGSTYVAYCFAQVAGYSAFGSYTGNGSSDGPFIYTGFRPAMIWTKPSSDAGAWNVLDNKRGPYNVNQPYLQQNSSNAEATVDYVDFLSNGFKIRYNGATPNGSGQTIIYIAFAENPFKYALAR